LAEYKNRIIGSGVEPLDQILFNPRNWRVHPLNQQNALKGVLEEVGWVQEVIINQRTGHLVDGHLRCQLAAREGAKTIPVKYVDLSEDEEALVLSTLDPIAAMATTDKQKLDELFASIETENTQQLLDCSQHSFRYFTNGFLSLALTQKKLTKRSPKAKHLMSVKNMLNQEPGEAKTAC